MTRHTGRGTGDWEGGARRGPRWGQVAVALAAVSVSVAVWLDVAGHRPLFVRTGREPPPAVTLTPDVVSTAPLQAGDRWFCPNTFAIRARADGHYYPPHFPRGEDLTDRPEGCYADSARAERDGYTLAPPPPGAVLVGGLYLVSPSAPGRDSCEALAADAGFTVPCPTRLPSPANGPSCREARCLFDGGVIIEQRSFHAPPDWTTLQTHVVITAVHRGAPPELIRCGPGGPPRAGRVVPCPASEDAWIPGIGGLPHAGHTMMLWRMGRVTFAASVEGYGGRQEDVLRAIVDAIAYVDPA